MILLDTHVWVWWVNEGSMASKDMLRIIQEHQGDGLGVSIISCWEVAKLVERGRAVIECRLTPATKVSPCHADGQNSLTVADERSAILWLRREMHQAGHEQLPELRAILEESFLQDEAGRWYVPDPGRAQDLERLRERALLREFRTHVEGRGRLKVFRSERSEAVRAGFGDAWHRRDYAVTPALRACASVAAVAQRLPERVVQKDADLLMVYDNALMRMETA